MSEPVKLGDRAKDTLTGFEGIVVGTCQYLTGCDQALLKPQKRKDDGSMLAGEWFDVQRLEVTKAGAYMLDNGVTPGGPQSW